MQIDADESIGESEYGDGVQLLAPDGRRRDHPDYPLRVTAEQCRALYRDMVLTRRLDAEAVLLQRQGELGMWIPSLGQEAAQIGSARAARPGDHVFPAYREHGVALCRGVEPATLMGLFRGVNHGGWDPATHGFHLYTIVIGSQVLHATGYAMGLRKRGTEGAVLAYFGDGAASQGDVNEAFNFAAVFDAPVVFFCQNNQWAISEPNERQTRVPIYQRAAGYGFPSVRVDGNDVLACLAVTASALERARGGGGPTLVEAVTYRMGPHTTADDPSRYRRPEEVELWARRDPIERLRRLLVAEAYAGDDFFAEVRRDADELTAGLRVAVRGMPDPSPEAIFAHAYAEPHPLVQEHAAAALAAIGADA
ncbi:pyruvate dehydrogenase (acetyl-transferring) E1 component subunit alpha [Rugosimonospora acidiphila]